MLSIICLSSLFVVVVVMRATAVTVTADTHHPGPVAKNNHLDATTTKTNLSSFQSPPTVTMDSISGKHIHKEEEDDRVKQRDVEHQTNATTVTMDLIVNCCNESLGWIPYWTQLLPQIRNVFIYNKCEQTHYETLGKGPRHNVSIPDLFPRGSASASSVDVLGIQELIINNDEDEKEIRWNVSGGVYLLGMPNVGREGHSWLTHFLHTSQQRLWLSDWTLSLQGRFETSIPAVLRGLDYARTKGCDFLDLHQYPTLQYPRRMPKNAYWGYQVPVDEPKYTWLRNHICKLHDNYTATTKDNQSKRPCNKAVVALRGEFLIHKSLIDRNRDNLKLHDLLERLSVSNDPLEGHFLERAWIHVLGTDTYCDLLPRRRRFPVAKQAKGRGKPA